MIDHLKLYLTASTVLLLLSCTEDTSSIETVMKIARCEPQNKQPAFLIKGIFSNCSEKTNQAKNNHIKLCAIANRKPFASGKN